MPRLSSLELLSSPPSGTEFGVTTTTVDLLLTQWTITPSLTQCLTRHPMQLKKLTRSRAHNCTLSLVIYYHRTHAPHQMRPLTTAAIATATNQHPWHHLSSRLILFPRQHPGSPRTRIDTDHAIALLGFRPFPRFRLSISPRHPFPCTNTRFANQMRHRSPIV